MRSFRSSTFSSAVGRRRRAFLEDGTVSLTLENDTLYSRVGSLGSSFSSDTMASSGVEPKNFLFEP